MKTLYLDLGMGAAGDMLSAALYELLPDDKKESFLERLNAAGIPGVRTVPEKAVTCGITGTHFSVLVNGEEEEDFFHRHEHHSHDHEHEHEHEHHHHSGMAGISHLVEGHLHISEKVKKDVLNVYLLIAEAESAVHGVPVEDIHFHEVGTLDAVADVTAVCMLMEELHPDRLLASPVHTGSGTVHCAHGILPVPAPATALLLKGIPSYQADIASELCTPTGAALVKHFVQDFGPMPVMKTEAIGYGLGKKEFPRANCVRAFLGETEGQTDAIIELSCNVDDMTAEELGFAMDRLFAEGALDVFTAPINMKKNRPGTLLCVLCRPQEKNAMAACIFRNTSTLGIRETAHGRYVLDRSFTEVETPFGTVRRKDVSGYGVKRSKFEYEDLAALAAKAGVSLTEARRMAEAAGQEKHRDH